MMCALILLCMNQHTKFEVPCFIDSKIYDWSNLKMGQVTLTTPIREYSVIESQALDIFYLRSKFGDCCFSCSVDMIAGVEIGK